MEQIVTMHAPVVSLCEPYAELLENLSTARSPLNSCRLHRTVTQGPLAGDTAFRGSGRVTSSVGELPGSLP